jgi:hypothetical protein
MTNGSLQSRKPPAPQVSQTDRFPPLVFSSFAFVVARVAVHVNAILAAKDGAKAQESPILEQWLIGAAVGLPVFAAGFRTYRASREFERNALRHRATLDSLEKLEEELRGTKELAEKFRLLGFCELVLEADCREFMRLLCEVERLRLTFTPGRLASEFFRRESVRTFQSTPRARMRCWAKASEFPRATRAACSLPERAKTTRHHYHQCANDRVQESRGATVPLRIG